MSSLARCLASRFLRLMKWRISTKSGCVNRLYETVKYGLKAGYHPPDRIRQYIVSFSQ
ncbi:hypothetical protein PSAB6_30223 [Paraburkholderia sabiae]|nr:hypothetical protein PSAB6_30223 [Paraburkholderia sabiae]